MQSRFILIVSLCQTWANFLKPFNGVVRQDHCGPGEPCPDNLPCYEGFCICSYPNQLFHHATRKCECLPLFQRSHDGKRCLIKHGLACDNSSECFDSLSCIEGFCKCPFPSQIFNTTTRTCISMVRGPCLEVVDGQIERFNCTANAECKEFHGIHECTCKEGYYTETEDGNCREEKPLGHKCSGARNCDTSKYLVCQNNTCACPRLYEYSEEAKICVPLVGAPCQFDSRGIQRCTKGAYCKALARYYRCRGVEEYGYCDRFINAPNGVCRCIIPENSTPERKCKE